MPLVAIFVGFLSGLALSVRFVQRRQRALIWGLVLSVVPLALLLGPFNAPVEGIGSPLYLAFLALGPLMLIPFAGSGIALGVAAGAAVLWLGQSRARWLGWAAGFTLVGIAAVFTVVPVAKREAVVRELAEGRDARRAAIMRADFAGTLAGHQVAFPASPRLSLRDNCVSSDIERHSGCRTSFIYPVQPWTSPDEELLHERKAPISFRYIMVSPVEQDCRNTDFCLAQATIDRWCTEYRPDQSDSIWCRETLPLRFSIQTNAHVESIDHPTYHDEPELAALFSDTPLGRGWVKCYYHPDKSNTAKQGKNCRLTFNLAEGVKVLLNLSRVQIKSNDPALAGTFDLIPEYWLALTAAR